MDAEAIAYCCRDDRDAIRLCSAWVAHCHLWDDVVDGDAGTLSPERLLEIQHSWQLELICNPFFHQHKLQLVPVMELAYSAWLDSNEWAEDPEPGKGLACHVLKGFWHEFVFTCARLKGGWSHYRDICREYRDYDFEDSFEEVAVDAADRLLDHQLNGN